MNNKGTRDGRNIHDRDDDSEEGRSTETRGNRNRGRGNSGNNQIRGVAQRNFPQTLRDEDNSKY